MNPSPARPRRLVAFPLSLLLAACGGESKGSSQSASKSPPRPVSVTTIVAEKKPLVYRVLGIGSLEAYQVVVVPAKVEGTLERLSLEEGQEIGPEQVLAVVDGEKKALQVAVSEATLSRLEAAVGSTDAQIASAEASRAEAQANLDRRHRMRAMNPGVVSDEELAGFEAQVARWKAAVDAAKAAKTEALAAVTEGKAKLALAKRDLADAEVRPPIAGRVERKHVASGQHVKAGEALATIVDVRRLRLRFRVTTAESVRIARKQTATFRTSALPGRSFTATIVHVSAAADPLTRMVECLADVGDPDPALKPGFFANVEVETGGGVEALVIPEEAILPTEQGAVVYVVEDGKAKRRRPVLGLKTSDGGVEILSGLAIGEKVVVRGAPALEEGSAVSVSVPGAGPGPAGKPTPPPSGTAPPPEPPPPAREGGRPR